MYTYRHSGTCVWLSVLRKWFIQWTVIRSLNELCRWGDQFIDRELCWASYPFNPFVMKLNIIKCHGGHLVFSYVFCLNYSTSTQHFSCQFLTATFARTVDCTQTNDTLKRATRSQDLCFHLSWANPGPFESRLRQNDPKSGEKIALVRSWNSPLRWCT